MRHRLFDPQRGQSLDDQQERSLAQLNTLLESDLMRVKHLDESPLTFFEAHECASAVPSVANKLTVQMNLFGGTLLRLGTERHHKLLSKVDRGTVMGCFALTEVGYGNNAVCMTTTATFDSASDTFDVHSPNPGSEKFWVRHLSLRSCLVVEVHASHLPSPLLFCFGFLSTGADFERRVSRLACHRVCQPHRRRYEPRRARVAVPHPGTQWRAKSRRCYHGPRPQAWLQRRGHRPNCVPPRQGASRKPVGPL